VKRNCAAVGFDEVSCFAAAGVRWGAIAGAVLELLKTGGFPPTADMGS
jgi:hypothetical protein